MSLAVVLGVLESFAELCQWLVIFALYAWVYRVTKWVESR